MTKTLIYPFLRFALGLVWMINGLYCKVLNQVPRHQEIVSRLLSEEWQRELTLLIGLSEIALALVIWSGWKRSFVNWTQIVLILSMNILEVVFVPELLLWGRWNGLLALFFVLFLYGYERTYRKSTNFG